MTQIKQLTSDEVTKILKEIELKGIEALKEDFNPLQQAIDQISQSDLTCQEFRQVADCEAKQKLPGKIMIFNRSEFGDNLMNLIDDLNAIGCMVQFKCRGKTIWIDITEVVKALESQEVACKMANLYIDNFKK